MITCRKSPYLVPEKALAKLFRQRFLHLARRALDGVTDVPEIPWSKQWVVFAKPTVQGADKVIEYLGRYVHKTAISERSLVGSTDRAVSFTYRESRTGERKTMSLPGDEFLRRFLQHVLPRGFHRVRAFGLLHPAHRTTLRRLQLLLGAKLPDPLATPPRPRMRCPHCKAGDLSIIVRLAGHVCVALAASRHPWTTGHARAPPIAGRAPR